MKSTIRQRIKNTNLPFSQTCRLSCRFERVTRKNTVGNSNVLTISAQNGLVNQLEYYNQQYASDNTSGYTLLKKGEFAYNKSYSDGYPLGAIKRLSRYEEGIVSPLYLCFSAKPGTCPEFYEQYFESGLFNGELYRIAQEGARNHGILNISNEDFFNTEIIDPPLEGQKRIAEILECCDRVIRLKRELIEEKKKQKKSLMQKLLNPDSGFRLPGFNGEWKTSPLKEITTYVDYRGKTPTKTATGIPLITAKNIKKGMIDYQASQEYVSHDEYMEVMHRGLPQIGDVLVTTEAPCGNVAQVDTPDIALAQRVIKFRGKKDVLDNRFLMYMLLSKQVQEKLISLSTGGTAQGIKGTTLHSLTINYPSVLEQIEISKILSSSDREIDLLEQDLTQWEQKKKSLMQLLLTGKVRV